MIKAFNELQNVAKPDYPYIHKNKMNLSNPPHYHTDMEIIAVLSGSVTAYYSGGTVKAEAGDLAVIMPKEVHHFATEVENRVHIIKLCCKNSVDLTDFSNYRFSGCLIKSGTELNREVFSHINKMASEYDQDTKGSAYAANAHANMILSLILRSDKCIYHYNDLAKLGEVTLVLLRRVTEYIEAHCLERISLEDVAAHCNMSKYHFSHTFKKATGLTFIEYLTSYRLNIALRLLAETNKNITQICSSSGFSSTRMFNHLFKAQFGITPTEYRKNHLK